MTPKQLNDLATAAYGPLWIARLAIDTGIHPATLRRWAAKNRPLRLRSGDLLLIRQMCRARMDEQTTRAREVLRATEPMKGIRL